MSYSTNYDFKFNNSSEQGKRGVACFSYLFESLSNKSDISGYVSVYIYKTVKYCTHNFTFSVEDVVYVFNKLSHVFEMPEIEDHFNDEDKGYLKVTFHFTNVTNIYIKTALTILRYFYEYEEEKYRQEDRVRDFKTIMQDAINYCREHPEESFIEVFQYCHHHAYINTNHAIMSIGSAHVLTKIVSDQLFAKRIKSVTINMVYVVFDGVEIINHGPNRENLKQFNQIDKI